MNSEIIPSSFEQKKNSRLKKRRGVADIISTMMLMAVTVTGASTLTYFVNDGFVSGNLGTVSTLDSSSLNLLLLAYDTRDSLSLLKLIDVDNKISGELCGANVGASCNYGVAPANSIPANDGTEFIVLQIQNNGIESIFLEDISINGVIHPWDSTTATIPLDASINYFGVTDRPYPSDGMFSILPVDAAPIQNDSIQIPSGKIVNLLIKLGPGDSDIQLNKGINVFLDTGGIHPVKFLILSGDAR